MRSRTDRAGQIEFEFGPLTRELAQSAQRELDIARAEFDRVVEIAELAPVPHLDRGAIAAFLALLAADAHPFRVVAESAERRGAGGADPFIAALVPPLLFGETLAQCLHQFVPAAK